MTQKLLSIIALLCLTFTSAKADVTYSYNESSQTLTISGTGAMGDYEGMLSIPWRNYRSSTKSIVIENGVTSIGNNAFSYFNQLTSVTIPTSVTSIGENAFYVCQNLTSVTIPTSVTSIGNNAFHACIGLASITFASGSQLTTIGKEAFVGCISLTSIEIPTNVTSIGNDVFEGCYRLTVITVADGNEYYSDDNGVLFNKDKTTIIKYPEGKTATSYTIPASVTSIGDDAFEYCSNLTSVTIPTSVTSIGNNAFSGSALTSVSIPTNVTGIGDGAFKNCTKLKSLTIPASVTSIGDDAFEGCSLLGSITVAAENKYYYSEDGVLFNKDKTMLIKYPLGKAAAPYTIPASVTTIGKYAFVASKLTSIEIPASVTTIGYSAFSVCTGLTSIEIPASVTSIAEGTFGNCSSLTSITFASGSQLTTIGKSAFKSCENLISVDIPASVTSIGDDAFWNCKGLTSITIPANVMSIGDDAFQSCSGLTSVKVYAPSCTLGSDAFAGATDIKKIYVPNVDAYKAADNWSNYSNLITGFLGVTLKPEYSIVPTVYAGVQNYFKLELTNNGSQAAQNVSATLYLGEKEIDKKSLVGNIAPGEKYADPIEFVDATIQPIIETTVIGDNNENAVYTVVVKEGDVEVARQKFSFVILYNGYLGKDYEYPSACPEYREFTFTGDVQILPPSVSTYMNSAAESRDESFTVNLGGDQIVYKAFLYVSYTWDKVDTGDFNNWETKFNGESILPIASYRDQSNLGKYGKYGYGLVVYDVTGEVVNGENTFQLGKTNGNVAVYPSSLIVMIDNPSSTPKAVYILEEADLLSKDYNKNMDASYKSSFDNLDKVADGKATLYVFAAAAQAGEGSLKINGETYADVWTGTSQTFDTYVKDVTIGSDGVSVEFISTGSTIQALHQMLVVDLSNRILIETGKPYIVKTLNDNSGVPVNCQTFLPVGYDLSKATVTLKPVKGAPKGLPVIIGSTTDGEVIPADAYLQLAADPGDTSGKITSDDIATDYNSVADDMSKRFVITDGKDNLSKILEGIKDVSASDAIFFVLTNGKFTRVSVSADDLAENANPAKSGLLLFVLTKWEYMNMGSGSGSSGQAGAGSRTIGIGEGGTTGISPIENEELRIKSSAGAWYDLQGRSLNGKPTRKGLYIYQGRKVVMK